MPKKALSSYYLSDAYFYYLVEKSGYPLEQASLLIEECLKMLMLLPNTKWFIPVSPAVDDIWHLMILETKCYQELCAHLPHKKFIHHQSVIYLNIQAKLEKKETQIDLLQRKEVINEKVSWLISYVTNFGDFTSETVEHWNWAKEIIQSMSISIEELNKMLREIQLSFS